MKLVTVVLYNKLGKPDEFATIGTWNDPKISAMNYYQVNTNLKLKAIVTIHATAESIEAYDSIRVKGKKMRILAKTEHSNFTQRLEVGV